MSDIHTFLPVIIDKITGRIAYVNVAHIEQIDPINKKAHTAGADGGTYQLADGWELPDCQFHVEAGKARGVFNARDEFDSDI